MTDAASNPLRPGEWSAMPIWAIRRRILRSMTKAECRVYIAMVAATRWDRGGTLSRGMAELAEETGLNARNVRWAIKGLTEKALIVRTHRGRGTGENVNRYTLLTHPEDLNRAQATCTQQENGAQVTPSVQGETAPSTGRNPTGYRAQPAREQGVSAPPPTEEQNADSRSPGAAADEDLDPRILDALIIAGIGEPLRSKLASLPGLTVRMIGEEADKVSCRANVLNKPAVVAVNLQARIQQERIRQADREAADRERQRERDREHAAAGAAAAGNHQARLTIERMNECELEARAREVFRRDDMHTRRWARGVRESGLRSTALTNQGFRAAVLRARGMDNAQ